MEAACPLLHSEEAASPRDIVFHRPFSPPFLVRDFGFTRISECFRRNLHVDGPSLTIESCRVLDVAACRVPNGHDANVSSMAVRDCRRPACRCGRESRCMPGVSFPCKTGWP